MNHIIITGASRGLGLAIAERLLAPGNRISCISRSRNEELSRQAAQADCRLDWFEFDLAETTGIERLLEEVLLGLDAEADELLALINNAGIVGPVRPLDRCSPAEIARNLQVDLLAPMILLAEFIRQTEGVAADRRVINISSGAGKKAYPGWSCYCTSKAGLDMVTRSVAEEQLGRRNPVRVISFAPGVVDTAMQDEIRRVSDGDFPFAGRFRRMQAEGQLLDPAVVAERVVDLLVSDIQGGAVLDIRDPLPT